MNPDYLELTYSAKRLPTSDYPMKLAKHLLNAVFRKPGRLLDVGCGTGEYLRCLADLGFSVTGIDSAPSAGKDSPGTRVVRTDLDRLPYPFPDASFDHVFSKSVLEHLAHPEGMLQECRRLLAPEGTLMVMTPSWRHTSRIFYEDLGHIRPFGINALKDALLLAGFKDVRVEYFRQLPVLWRAPALVPLAALISLLPLPYRPWDPAPWPEGVNRWIRFSKEVMLLGVGIKRG